MYHRFIFLLLFDVVKGIIFFTIFFYTRFGFFVLSLFFKTYTRGGSVVLLKVGK